MKRVYKLLLPLFREEEMASEIDQEWILDSKGQDALSFTLFTKLLFRIAHHWAQNIDLDEYIDLLNKIYERISVKRVVRRDRGTTVLHPTIQVTFPLEEKKI